MSTGCSLKSSFKDCHQPGEICLNLRTDVRYPGSSLHQEIEKKEISTCSYWKCQSPVCKLSIQIMKRKMQEDQKLCRSSQLPPHQSFTKLCRSSQLPPHQSFTKLRGSSQLPPHQSFTKLRRSSQLPPHQNFTKLCRSSQLPTTVVMYLQAISASWHNSH